MSARPKKRRMSIVYGGSHRVRQLWQKDEQAITCPCVAAYLSVVPGQPRSSGISVSNKADSAILSYD